DHDHAAHSRVVQPAVFRASQRKASHLRRGEPELRITPGKDVLFDAESRDVEAVNHILRGHRQPHRLTQRDVQGVDFALAGGMLYFPHPLLRHDVESLSVRGRGSRLGEEYETPEEYPDEQGERHQRPCELDTEALLVGACPVGPAAATISDAEEDD